MTIIQASICNKNKAIILVGDRLVTAHETCEVEARSHKLYRFGQFGIGFAKALSDIICVKDAFQKIHLHLKTLLTLLKMFIVKKMKNVRIISLSDMYY